MLDITSPEVTLDTKPRIIVIGVGGAGGNAIENMIRENLEGCEFVAANTDAQALKHSSADKVIQLGNSITNGLGAGADPDIGCKAAEESIDNILEYIHDANMIFIAAGMGGGTGTGASPIIARYARERNILTVGVVTKPFDFEGSHRMKQAKQGIVELQKFVDTLIVIPNQNLFYETAESTTLTEAFKTVDKVLCRGVRGVTDLMIKPGLINLDFNDIRTVMREMGKAVMGTGEASGEDCALNAAENAINNKLLDDDNMKGARSVLLNITASAEISLTDITNAANRVRQEVAEDANIIFGTTIDETLGDVIRVSIIATGIDVENINGMETGVDLDTKEKKEQDRSTTVLKTSAMPGQQDSAEENMPSAPSDSFPLTQEDEQKKQQNVPISQSIYENPVDFTQSADPSNTRGEGEYSPLFQDTVSQKQGFTIDPFLEADLANATWKEQAMRRENNATSLKQAKKSAESVELATGKTEESISQTQQKIKETGSFFKRLFSGIKRPNKPIQRTEPILSVHRKENVEENVGGSLHTSNTDDVDIPEFLRKKMQE